MTCHIPHEEHQGLIIIIEHYFLLKIMNQNMRALISIAEIIGKRIINLHHAFSDVQR